MDDQAGAPVDVVQVDEGEGQRQAEVLAWLLLRMNSWINRRVESVAFNPDGETRRSVSVDFTLPEDQAVPGSRNRVLVPVALVNKGTLRHLDVVDANGSALPVLGWSDNARRATSALRTMARHALLGRPGVDLAWLDERIAAVVSGEAPAEAASEISERVRTWIGDYHDQELSLLDWEITEFVEKFWLIVEIPKELVGTRTIVKYSYDMPFGEFFAASDDLPTVIGLDMPQLRVAKSVHLEVRAPRGLEISRLTLQESWPVDDDWEDRYEVDDGSDGDRPGHIAHVATYARQPFSGQADAWVELLPHRRGLVSAALASAWVGLALLGLPFTVTVLGGDWWGGVVANDGRSGSVAAVLLAAPAVLAAWFARPSEHKLVAQILWVPRRALLVTSGTLFVSAILTATGASSTLASVTGAILFATELLVVVDISLVARTVRGSS